MPVFKIGDKVREVAVDGKSIAMQGHWDLYWSSREGPVKDGIFTITRVLDGGYYEYSNKIGGEGPQTDGKYFELVEPATQTPQPSFIKTVPARRKIVEASVKTGDSNANCRISPQDRDSVCINISTQIMTAKDLREAATIFNQIADVLEENSNA